MLKTEINYSWTKRTLYLLAAPLSVRKIGFGWLGGSVVERRSVTGELSLVCTGPAADG